MKVLELKGYKSLQALNAFHKLILGLKMLPAYMTESYEDFLNRIEVMPIQDKEKMIREAALFVELQKEEVEVMVGFCTDPNGVPWQAENIKSLGPAEIFECIVAVSMEMVKIKIDLVSESEKKK